MAVAAEAGASCCVTMCIADCLQEMIIITAKHGETITTEQPTPNGNAPLADEWQDESGSEETSIVGVTIGVTEFVVTGVL